jgi:hypothetical protein
VSQLLTEATSLLEVVPQVLRTIADAMRWELGTYWGVSPGGTTRRPDAAWHAPSLASRGVAEHPADDAGAG